MKYAIIGGTGVYELSQVEEIKTIDTEYGEALVYIININGQDIVFLPRHGRDHTKPPHLINYRANIMALKKLGIECIFTTAAVGSCNISFEPGDIVIIKDFLDFTKLRANTFFDGEKYPVRHVRMGEPYCKILRERFYSLAKTRELLVRSDSAVYACTEGPRFETAAEIKMFEKLGADVVGMTSVPEAVLAKELGMCYATIAIVTNWCTGFIDEDPGHNVEEIVMENRDSIAEIIFEIFREGIDREKCRCKDMALSLEFK